MLANDKRSIRCWAGLDASANGTGLSIARHSPKGPDVFYSVRFSNPEELRGTERLQYVRDVVCSELYKNHVQWVLIENYAFGFNPKRSNSIYTLGELGGVLRLAFYEMGLPYSVCPPSAVKMWLVGKGNAKKEECLAAVRQMGYDLAAKDFDRADSIALALVGGLYLSSRPLTKAKDQRVVSTVEDL